VRRPPPRALLALAGALAALALAPAAPGQTGQTTPTQPVYDAKGRLIEIPFAPPPEQPRLKRGDATAFFLAVPKVRDWLERYPPSPQTDATFKGGFWTVKVWSGDAGEIATGKVNDATGEVVEAWTGPQVAWKMARGGDGAFGGRKINSYPVWLGLCALFLLGLADLRRPLSVRNLDLLVLLSFSVSLWFFNRGDIFTALPLAYPPLVYLIGRAAWAAWRGRGAPVRSVWPVWVLTAATVFLLGFRIGLNARASNVIDVGYAGVIGADRIVHGSSPYGHFPVEGTLKACGPADSEGEIRERIQTNGRCESANDRGDTYGPVAYLAYVPGFLVKGWTGKWDDLPAAHVTSVLWDLVCLAGLYLVGRRFGGQRLAAMLTFAWASYPFTQYVSNSNTNDAVMPALLVWGFWLASSPVARGTLGGLAGLTKFGALLVLPLWAAYPEFRLPRVRRFLLGLLLACALCFWVLLLEPDPLHAARVFWDRTLGWQLDRESPFSIWDWRQYHAAGVPDLHLVQRALELVVLAAAGVFAFLPRRKSPLQLAALTAILLLGFELVLTHWFYLYIPWFFPFIAFVVLAPAPAAPAPEPAEEPGERALDDAVVPV
jgi:hypothetical protein